VSRGLTSGSVPIRSICASRSGLVAISLALLLALLLAASPAAAAPTQVAEYSSGLTGSPRELVVGAEGDLWFSVRNVGAIGRVGPAGGITEYEEGLEGASPTGLIVGPGGDIWFGLKVDNQHSYIGRIDAAGSVTLYGGLLTHTSPDHLALGPEGNVWFVSSGGTRPSIGYVTPLGAGAQFELPGYPDDLAAGPGGNMWFTYGEEGSAAIGRAVLEEGGGSTITLFRAGLGAKSAPGQLVAGPDGNLWFVDRPAGAVGRVTPSGDISEFGSVEARPEQIVAGAGGDLWVRESHGVGRITTSGVWSHVEVPPLQEGRRAEGIALGPEGDLWFAAEASTEYLHPNGTVGRVTPTGRVTDYGAGLPPGSAPMEIVPGGGSDLWFGDDGAQPAIGHIVPGEDPEPAAILTSVSSSNVPSLPAATGPGKLSLRLHSLRVGRGGGLRIPVSCTGSSMCTGRVTLTSTPPKTIRRAARVETIAARSYSVSGLAPGSISVRLNRSGRHLLAARHGHAAAIATFESGPRLTELQAVQVRLRSGGR
jgi:streptogramin lyase